MLMLVTSRKVAAKVLNRDQGERSGLAASRSLSGVVTLSHRGPVGNTSCEALGFFFSHTITNKAHTGLSNCCLRCPWLHLGHRLSMRQQQAAGREAEGGEEQPDEPSSRETGSSSRGTPTWGSPGGGASWNSAESGGGSGGSGSEQGGSGSESTPLSDDEGEGESGEEGEANFDRAATSRHAYLGGEGPPSPLSCPRFDRPPLLALLQKLALQSSILADA